MPGRSPLPAPDNSHLEVSLPLPPLFDVDLTLESLQRSSYAVPCHFASESRGLRRLMYLDGTLVLIEFEFPLHGDELKAGLLVGGGTEGGNPPGLSTQQLERLASTSWGLGDDLTRCYAVLGEDASFAPVLPAIAACACFVPRTCTRRCWWRY